MHPTAGTIRLLVCAALLTAPPALADTSGTLDADEAFDTESAFGPGDRKEGYDSTDYTTRSLSLQNRRGKPADLIRFIEQPPLGLPPVPQGATATREQIALGRKLFFDRRLSINDTFACATCHIPEQGFTNHEMRTAVGVEGRSVLRNSPTLFNAAYLRHVFLDGREHSLENQVWEPLTARNEMAAPSIGWVLRKLRAMPDYDGLFEDAFDGRGPDILNVGQAIAAYQRTLQSADSPFDRWHFGGDDDAVGSAVKRGFALFTGKAACHTCHLIAADHALFQDHQFHNTGLGYKTSTGKTQTKPTDTVRIALAPGIFTEIKQSAIDAVTQQRLPNDLGLYRVTESPNDRWKFRTQGLRNIALTAPYMHNGQFDTLRQVIDFYDEGGIPNELLSPLIRPLNLTEDEKQDLEAFLNALTGSNVVEIVSDAFAAPIGDLGPEDPNWAHNQSP